MGDPSEKLESADSQEVTPAELLALMTAIAELTTALRTFVNIAEELYPHVDLGLPLMKRLRQWRRVPPSEE